MTDRTASDIFDDLRSDLPPTKPASDLLDADRMREEGERQARQQQRDDAMRNAGGGPKLQ